MSTLVEDGSKNIAVFINDFYPELPVALTKLSKRLGRPLKGIMLIDKTAYEQGRYHADKDHLFEEVICDFTDPGVLRATIKTFEANLLLIDGNSERSQPYFKLVVPHVPYVLTPTESSLEWATHKGQMRALVGGYDPTLVPRVHVVKNDSDETISSVLSKLDFPMIVKPTGLAASILVNKVSNEAELRKTLTESFEAIDEIYARDAGRWEPEMIVEEFMEGEMYSVDMYLDQIGDSWALPLVRAKTAHAMGLEGFYEYQLETDITLDAAMIMAGQSAAREAAHALGLRSCTAHVELYLTASGWKIIELGPRPGGHRQFLYDSAYGIDHAYNNLLVKIGLEPENLGGDPLAYSLIANTYAEEEGVIESIEGLEEARQLPSVLELDAHYGLGDLALPSGKGGKILADAKLSHPNKEQLLADTAKLREHITVRTKPHVNKTR